GGSDGDGQADQQRQRNQQRSGAHGAASGSGCGRDPVAAVAGMIGRAAGPGSAGADPESMAICGSVRPVRARQPAATLTAAGHGAAQTRTVVSALAEARCRPSGAKASARTAALWPANCRSSLPVSTSHTRTDPSKNPAATDRPPGPNATQATAAGSLVIRRST